MFSGASIEFLDLHYVGDVHRSFAFHNCALGILLALAHVLLDHSRAFNNDALLLGRDADDPAAFAFVRAGNQYHFVAFFNMKSCHKIAMPERN